MIGIEPNSGGRKVVAVHVEGQRKGAVPQPLRDQDKVNARRDPHRGESVAQVAQPNSRTVGASFVAGRLAGHPAATKTRRSRFLWPAHQMVCGPFPLAALVRVRTDRRSAVAEGDPTDHRVDAVPRRRGARCAASTSAFASICACAASVDAPLA